MLLLQIIGFTRRIINIYARPVKQTIAFNNLRHGFAIPDKQKTYGFPTPLTIGDVMKGGRVIS